jgi:2-keto-4-pentenoate hydratase/2-oxohepta-3-ene-1,7-dioic acid hydratase in catechol pathway
MKFVRYQVSGKTSFGILEDDTIQEILGSIFGDFKTTSVKYKVSQVRLLPPVEPTKILCVGLNFRDHIEELGDKVPEYPSHFLKPLTTVIGPDDPILYPRVASRVDYEGELAVVIKDRIKDVSLDKALDHVLGYTCFNDITERELARKQGQLTRAKGFDTFASFGPCIATGLDPAKLTVQTYLNGKLVQEGRTENLIFSIPFLVHYLSQCMTFLPGDLISTGTPRGVGPLKLGDIVEVTIKGIGTLRNSVQLTPQLNL